MNSVRLTGHLGSDPEIKYTPSGTMCAKFSVATNSKYNDKEVVTWHRVVAWSQAAEMSADLKKGDKVHVMGSLTNNKWTDKQGAERMTVEVKAYAVFKYPERGPSDESPSVTDEDIPF